MAVALSLATAPAARAVEPITQSLAALSVHNARFEQVQLAGRGLEATITELRRGAPDHSWIVWTVPGVPGFDGCCWNRNRRGCCLGDRWRGISFSCTGCDGSALAPFPAEDRPLVVLLGISGGEIHRVAAFSSTCPIDAAGAPLYWIEDVDSSQSTDYLASLVEDSALREEALMPLALHFGARAEQRLIRFARDDRRPDVREDALFWLSQRGGELAVDTLLAAVAEDPDDDVREQAVFALSQLPDDAGTLLLLDLAKNRSLDAEVRQQAIFWLAQSEDPRALDLLTAILRRTSN